MKKIVIPLLLTIFTTSCGANNDISSSFASNDISKDNDVSETDLSSLEKESSSKESSVVSEQTSKEDIIMHNKTNYHTHTYRCNHANGSDEDYILAAIDSGYDLLGFSDHVMLPWTTNENSVRGTYDKIDEYFSSIRNLKEKYKDKIDILVAFECEWDDLFKDYYSYLLESQKCDYLIFGNHYIDYNSTTGNFSEYFAKDGLIDKELLKRYFDNANKALSSGLFRIFAHPDYFMYSWDNLEDKEVEGWVRNMCQVAKDNNVALEINQGDLTFNNTKQYPSGTRYRYPYKPFWDIAKEIGNEIITSVDAHTPSAISAGTGRTKALELAASCNITITEDLLIESKEPIENYGNKTTTINVINGKGSKKISRFENALIEANVPEGSYFDYWLVNGKKNTTLGKSFTYTETSTKEKEMTFEAIISDAISSYEYVFDKSFVSGNNTFGSLVWNSSLAGSSLESGTSISRGAGFKIADNGGTLTLSCNIPFEINKIVINSAMGSGGNTTFSIYVGDTLICKDIAVTNNASDYSYDVNNLTGTLKIIYKASVSGKVSYIKSIKIN